MYISYLTFLWSTDAGNFTYLGLNVAYLISNLVPFPPFFKEYSYLDFSKNIYQFLFYLEIWLWKIIAY